MKKLMLLLTMFCLIGCSPTINTSIMPNVKMTDYKTAYIQNLPKDEFNMSSKIMFQLANMGYKVIGKEKPDNPTNSDMLINYSYHGDWDFGYYLQAFQIRFLNAKTNEVLGIIDFNRHGNFGYEPDKKIADAFDDFRSKL